MQLGKVEMSFMVPVEVTRGSMRGVIVDAALGGGGEANSTSDGDLGRWRRGQLLQEFEASQQLWLGEAHKASLEECASEATQVTWAVLGIVIVVGAAALRLHSGGNGEYEMTYFIDRD
ncbi:hypothetical protein OsI_28904 [Oryza sativa Indica Group]|uniref:Uncharacterized protein n=1 Tax=Oryza sativa subsp. indica TaxID=39946 RepID=B8B9Z5_ORYSI|nr:hypothetical protein OsI_28904 [Oryza sativa Indica Group]